MPQTVTFNINAKVEKGPEIKSEVKFEAGSYGAVIEEVVCKCSPSEEFELPLSKIDCIDMLVISSDKYYVDKETCMPTNGGMKMDCTKSIQYWFIPADATSNTNQSCPAAASTAPVPAVAAPAASCASVVPSDAWSLTRPLVLMWPHVGCVVHGDKTAIRFQNNLTTDIKISAMVIRRKKEKGC